MNQLPLEGAAVLDELRQILTTYVVFPDDHAAAAVTLWVACTHAVPAFEFAPRLVVNSPEKRCGKSRMLDIIAGTCHDPLASVSATVAAIYRSLGSDHPPTLVIDEADTLFGSKRVAEQHEELRALLNAGHQRGRTVLRCVGQLSTPTKFPTFAMAVLAGIGAMPDTITDRAVNVTLRRRARHEQVANFRSRRDGPRLTATHDRLAAWCAEHLDELTKAEPPMPVEDRAADTWEPLIAIADAAGGHWPDTARAACLALVHAAQAADDEHSSRIKLLADIRHIYDTRSALFLPTIELLAELHSIEESPWGEFKLSARSLAKRLKEFGIHPVRDTAGQRRGYRLADFSDAFTRYLRQESSEASETNSEQEKLSDAWLSSDGLKCQNYPIRQSENAEQAVSLTVLTDSDGSGQSLQCRYCNADIPAHMSAQRSRGFCGRSACVTAAREDLHGQDAFHKMH